MTNVTLTLSQALGRALAACKQGKLIEAEQLCQQIIAAKPDVFDAFHLLAFVQAKLGKKEAALKNYDRAIALQPANAEAFNNRGNALKQLNRFEEAIASYDRALTLKPAYADALNNRGNALQELKRFDEALASYDRALAIRPDFAEIHYNQALFRLLVGDFDRGWEEHEWRWQCDWLRNSKRSFAEPIWLGKEDISGKTILIHAEQGFGDTIQFCRYVPSVVGRGARVILEVPKRLHELMSAATGASQVVSKGEPLPDFDVQSPLLSLPLAFGTRLETISSSVPYLRASPQNVINWNTRLGRNHRPRIGVAWSGSPTHKKDHNRSIAIGALLSLFEIDATFVSLQKDVRRNDAAVLQNETDLVNFGDDLKDFSDTAALIANLDLVISVDTSVAHLAGALAKPVWVLLPYLPDWRWLLDRDDSPWYPTARLFRQDETRSWEPVIARVHAALANFVQIQSP
jgi:hypothetical protein